MIIYRNSYFDEEGSHAGYTWHSSKRKADEEARSWEDSGRELRDTAEPIVVASLTKRELIRMLNCYADHPNNG